MTLERTFFPLASVADGAQMLSSKAGRSVLAGPWSLHFRGPGTVREGLPSGFQQSPGSGGVGCLERTDLSESQIEVSKPRGVSWAG